MTILINKYTKTALSVESGEIIRNVIIEAFSQNNTEDIILDFSGITLFATMFFNASVGYLVKERRDDIMNRIKLSNLSALGKRTYDHSVQNAITILDEECGKIVNDTINEA